MKRGLAPFAAYSPRNVPDPLWIFQLAGVWLILWCTRRKMCLTPFGFQVVSCSPFSCSPFSRRLPRVYPACNSAPHFATVSPAISPLSDCGYRADATKCGALQRFSQPGCFLAAGVLGAALDVSISAAVRGAMRHFSALFAYLSAASPVGRFSRTVFVTRCNTIERNSALFDNGRRFAAHHESVCLPPIADPNCQGTMRAASSLVARSYERACRAGFFLIPSRHWIFPKEFFQN
jgi:hypothetical protein